MVRRHLGGDVHAALARARGSARRAPAVETCATCRCAPVSSREQEVARDVHLLGHRRDCRAGRAASRPGPRSRRRRRTSVRSSQWTITGTLDQPRVLEHAAHHAAVHDRLAVVARRPPRPAATSATISVITLPSRPRVAAAIGQHARGRVLARAVEDVVGHRRVVVHRVRVRHAGDRGEAARHGGAAARGDVFLVLLARLAQVAVQVDEAGRDPAAARRRSPRAPDAAMPAPTAVDHAVLEQHVADARRVPTRDRAARPPRIRIRLTSVAPRLAALALAAGEQVEHRHAHRDAVAHLVEDHARAVVGEIVRELDAAVDRARVHHDRVVLGVAQLAAVEAEGRGVLAHAREVASPSSRSLWMRSAITTSAPSSASRSEV